MLEYVLSKVDFSVDIGIYIPPSNLNVNTGKTKGHNNKILVSNTDMKIGSGRAVNRDRKKRPITPPDVPKKKVTSAAQHNPPHNLKMLTEKYSDEKLIITILTARMTCLLTYHFW